MEKRTLRVKEMCVTLVRREKPQIEVTDHGVFTHVEGDKYICNERGANCILYGDLMSTHKYEITDIFGKETGEVLYTSYWVNMQVAPEKIKESIFKAIREDISELEDKIRLLQTIDD